MEPLSVLLVDDDPDLGNLMRMLLSREAPDISFHFVEGGGRCLEYLKENRTDCIVSDYQMPGMNGMELLLAIRDQGNDVPFIFLTGQGNEEVARDALKGGADDYFTKDIGLAHFARITNSVLQSVKKRRAVQSKRKAERDWAETFDAIDDLITLQRTDFTIERCNRAACEKLSRDGEDIAGKKCYEIFHGTAGPIPNCPAVELMEGGAVPVTHEVAVGDRVYEVKVCPVMADGSFNTFVHIAKDITKRKVAEQALIHEKEFTDTVVNSLPGAFYVYDDQLRLVRWNRRYMEVLGVPPGEERQLNALDTVAEEDRELAASKIRDIMIDHKDAESELTVVDVHGKKTPFYCTGSPLVVDGRTYLVGVGIDITERKKAEQAVERSSDTLRTILDSVNFGMVVVGRDRIIRMVNRTALQMAGYASESDVVGKPCHNVICPAEEGKCPVFDLGMDLDLSHRALLHRDGRAIPVLKSVSRIPLGGEDVLLETFVDISGGKLMDVQ